MQIPKELIGMMFEHQKEALDLRRADREALTECGFGELECLVVAFFRIETEE